MNSVKFLLGLCFALLFIPSIAVAVTPVGNNASPNYSKAEKIGGSFPSPCGLIGYICKLVATVDEPTSKFNITAKLSSKNNANRSSFFSDEPIDLQFTLKAPIESNTFEDSLYVIAKKNTTYYMLTSSGWILWDGQLNHLVAFLSEGRGTGSHTINLLTQQSLPAGEYIIYAGCHYHSAGNLPFLALPFIVFDKEPP
ncbi:MAG: hypothetical protein ABL903_10740 [Methylococcales bacterium]